MLPLQRTYACSSRLFWHRGSVSLRHYANLTLENMNPNILHLEYAVRGPIVARAAQIRAELEKGAKKPFKEVISCNIGDCHAMGQQPISFLRQVIALVSYPKLFDSPDFPADAKDRARRVLESCSGHSTGSYSDSTGIAVVRKDIAKYIEERDGIPAHYENIFLATGASGAIKSLLQLLSTTRGGKERAGVMVPIPQYPLYSATNAEYNAYQINYYLDEGAQWGLNEAELERSIKKAHDQCFPRAIVVINPGNPTGQLLSRGDIETVLKFAKKHNLVVLADEVYQHNVYAPNKNFVSFKKVLHDLGPGYADSVELASFMSASKGFMGECGYRGGYCELTNFHPDVQAQLYKCLSAKLCTSTIGQTMMDIVVNPPRSGEPSYESFIRDRSKVLDDLKEKARLTTETFNSIPGFQCNPVQGAMYAFPRIELPKKALEAAKSNKQAPDFLYCLQLLENTGVCVVPGSGFGQMPNTHHFRMTILPPVEKMKIVMEKIKSFHNEFMKKYS